MKRDEIREKIPGITDEQLEWLMAEHGRDVQSLAAVTAERDGLREQLNTANAKLTGYDPDWQDKVTAAQQATAAKVAEVESGYAAERAVSGLKFSSDSAKKAFLADLTAKKLPLQDGKLLGFDDFAKAYKEADPGAFLPEGGVPRVTAGTGGAPAAPTGKDAANAAFRALFGKE